MKFLSTSKKVFFKQLLFLALPIMAQNLLVSSASFVDTLMVGKVGESALAAVGLANQLFFLIALFYFGVSSGAAIFIAQYWGAQDKKSMHKVIGLALMINLFGALAATIASFFFPELLLGIFTKDETVIRIGSEYLKVVAISYLFSAVVMIFSTALRSTTDARTPLYISIISLFINIGFNYVLIFGKFGFPRLEVKGAALATAIARAAEMVILLIIIYRNKKGVAASLKEYLSFDKTLVKTYLTVCLPVIFNEILWSLGMTAYKVAYAKMGVEVIAAVNVIEAIQSLFFVVLMGTSNATAIMVGNKIGENKIAGARLYAKMLLFISFASGIVLGLFLFSLAKLLIVPFSLSREVGSLTASSLRTMSLLVPIKAVNMVLIVGLLRSGGDTRFSMFTELFGVWLIGVPCAFIGVLVLSLPLHFLYLFVGLEELFKFFIGLFRIKSNKWITRLA
ncbi:MAG: MATE family efflux transporter [Sphaerochaetaceae bacterium]